MISYRSVKLAIPILLLWAFSSSAQVPVVDASSGSNSRSNTQSSGQLGQLPSTSFTPSSTSQPVSTSGASNEVVVNLYLQLEQLQQEVQTLRGIVEEQSFQLRRMQAEQRDRYIDLDGRLSEMNGAAGGGVSSGSGFGWEGAESNGVVGNSTALDSNAGGASYTSPVVVNNGTGVASNSSGQNQGNTSLQATAENEQAIYRSALNLLLEASEYEESIQSFQRYIDNYPQGSYLTNAYYWQGEAFILVGRLAQAGDSFRKILDSYPDDPKAADAMLKLGVVQNQSGDTEQARTTWENIRTRYPDSIAAIRAAEDYLSRL